MKLSDLNYLQYFINQLGGKEEVAQLEFQEYFLEPYSVSIVKPWSFEFDLSFHGYRRGNPIFVFNDQKEFIDQIKTSRFVSFEPTGAYVRQDNLDELERMVENYTPPTVDTLLTDEQAEELKELEEETPIYLPTSFKETIKTTAHGKFIILQFFDTSLKTNKFVALWVSQQIDPNVKQSLLENWRQRKAALNQAKRSNQIIIDLSSYSWQEDDKLEINILPEQRDARFTRQEIEVDSERVQILEDYLEAPIYLFPQSDWWVTFNIVRSNIRIPMEITAKQGYGGERISTYQGGSYFIQLSQTGGFANRTVRPLFEKRSQQQYSTIRSTLTLDESSP